MKAKKETPRSGNYDGVKVSTSADTEIVAEGWTRAQCRAIEIGVGGGWLLMAVLAVVAW